MVGTVSMKLAGGEQAKLRVVARSDGRYSVDSGGFGIKLRFIRVNRRRALDVGFQVSPCCPQITQIYADVPLQFELFSIIPSA